jgi:glutathione synthase/RimK-type ligase-like ATP-grasp enzyme
MTDTRKRSRVFILNDASHNVASALDKIICDALNEIADVPERLITEADLEISDRLAKEIREHIIKRLEARQSEQSFDHFTPQS